VLESNDWGIKGGVIQTVIGFQNPDPARGDRRKSAKNGKRLPRKGSINEGLWGAGLGDGKTKGKKSIMGDRALG